MRLPVWIACAVLMTTACQKNSAEEPVKTAMTKMNVPYGTDAKQQMDLYLPANRSVDSTRVIILIHGGAWVDGDKADFNSYVSVLQSQLPGHAIFNINYRLAANGQNLFPSQENDVQSAVNFIYDRRDEYGISDNFVFLGASAGAHLALLQGYKHTDRVKPTAIISFFGPSELKSLYQSSPLAGLLLGQLLGTTPSVNPAVYDQSSPFFYAGVNSSPTMILQGGKDDVVPPSQSENLRAKLDAAGVETTYVFYPNEAHGWFGANLTDSFIKIAAFLRANP